MLAFALAGCGRTPEPAPQKNQGTSPPSPGFLGCLGRVVAGEGTRRIAAPQLAIVSELKVQRGSRVRTGDVIAVLQEYAPAMAAFREAEQQVAVAESTIEQVKAPDKQAAIAAQEAVIARQRFVLKNLESEFGRQKRLFAEKLIPAMDVENSEVRVQTAQEELRRDERVLAGLQQFREVDVDLARKKLAAAIAARDRAKVEAEKNLVRAPMNGTVLEIFARAGETVTAERGILDLGDTENMFVEAEVYATDFPRVREGAKAEITGEAIRGTLRGKVEEVLREAGESTLFPVDPLTATDKRVIRVRIRLEPKQGVERLSGLQVNVRIEP